MFNFLTYLHYTFKSRLLLIYRMAMGQEELVGVEVDAGKPVARHTRQVGEHSTELAHPVSSQKLSRPQLRLNLQMECVHGGGALII